MKRNHYLKSPPEVPPLAMAASLRDQVEPMSGQERLDLASGEPQDPAHD
jgi:hypothetical protein